MPAWSLLVLVLSLLSLTARAQAPLRHLPPPLAKGGYAGYLVPSPLSGPLGFHVRGTLLAMPGDDVLGIGGQVGLSMSFVYGEAGASFFGAALLARDAAPVQHRGPIEVWMRLGPFYSVSKDRSGLVLSAFGEYAVARAEVDAGGTLIPETTTLGLVAGWHKGWTEAHLSGAYQRGVDGESTYHGAQLGGALWLRFFHALQAGAEALVRSGCFAGTASCRPGAMGLIGLRALDRHGVGGGLAAGLGFGEDMPAWMVMGRFGFTVGEGFKPPPRTTDLEQDIRDWLAARARRRAEEAQQLAQQRQQQMLQQQLAQDAAQRQALVQALARRYPLGGGPPPPLVSPVCVRRPCQVAGWRFEQAVDRAVSTAWSRPDEPGEPAPRGPGRGIAQARPPWRPPTRPPVRVVPLPGPRPERPDRRSVGERIAETPPAAFRPQPPSYHQPTIDVQGAPPRPPTMQGPGSWPEGPPPWMRTQEAEHVRPPQAEPPPPPRPQQQVAEHVSPAQQLINAGSRWQGKFPERVDPSSETQILYRRDPRTGQVTNYQVYDASGNPIKRVDLTGRPHGGVPPPHVVEYEQHTRERDGRTFIKPKDTVRKALPEEIP
jgi:hypothetical protein